MEKNIYIIIYFLLLFFFGIFFIRKGYYKLNHQSLLVQPLFWVSIGIPLVTCLFFGSLIWIEKFHSFSLTSHGYQRFLEISKLPLLILAAAVPLTSIVNNLHRTIQTEKQINESEKKNITDGYYAHAKFQTDYLKSLPETELKAKIKNNEGEYVLESKIIKIAYPLSLYKKIYQKSNPINGVEYEADKNYTKIILRSWVQINSLLKVLRDNRNLILQSKTDDHSNMLKTWYLLEIEIIKLCNQLEIIYPAYQKVFIIQHHTSKLTTSIASLKEMFRILEAVEDISIGIIDAANQFTMAEALVFSKTNKLFTTTGLAIELEEMNAYFYKSQIDDTETPKLTINGETYQVHGDTLAADH